MLGTLGMEVQGDGDSVLSAQRSIYAVIAGNTGKSGNAENGGIGGTGCWGQCF